MMSDKYFRLPPPPAGEAKQIRENLFGVAISQQNYREDICFYEENGKYQEHDKKG